MCVCLVENFHFQKNHPPVQLFPFLEIFLNKRKSLSKETKKYISYYIKKKVFFLKKKIKYKKNVDVLVLVNKKIYLKKKYFTSTLGWRPPLPYPVPLLRCMQVHMGHHAQAWYYARFSVHSTRTTHDVPCHWYSTRWQGVFSPPTL